MDIVNDYLDILQNIETAIISFFHENPGLRDTEVIQACERLVFNYTREKKRLPALPFSLPEKSMALYEVMKAACETRITRDSTNGEDDPEVGYRVPLRIMVICLGRLHDSMLSWHKRNGQRGYLEFISPFIK